MNVTESGQTKRQDIHQIHTHAQSTPEKGGEGEGKKEQEKEDKVNDGHTAVCSFFDPHSYTPSHFHFSLEGGGSICCFAVPVW